RADHRRLLGAGADGVAGAGTGVVAAAALLGPETVRAGDVPSGLPSSGIHSNGYSLVRHIIAEAGWDRDRQVAEFGRTLGEELLVPTHVYTGELAALFDALPTAVHSVSHVTG